MEDNINGIILQEEIKPEIKSNIDVNLLDKDIFFDVKEAKKRTDAIHKKILEVEMLPIYQAISDGISKGLNEIEYYRKLSTNQASFLKAKGFTIYTYSSAQKTKISWI